MNKKMISAIIITFFVFLFILLLGPRDQYSHGYYNEVIEYNSINPEDFMGSVDLGRGVYEGKFIPQSRHLAGFELNFINMPEDNTGDIIVSVLDSKGKLINTTVADLSKMKATEWYKVFLDANLVVGRTYNVKIEAKNCATYPYMQLVDNDYLGKENVDSNLLIGYAYAKSTFTFPEKAMIIAGLLSVWMIILGKLLIANRSINKKIIGVSLFTLLTVGLSWNYMFNSLNAQNTDFSKFQATSEELVESVIQAEYEKVGLNRYGLGFYFDTYEVYNSEDSAFISNEKWTNGYSINSAKILVKNNEYTRSSTTPGSYILFSNGDAFQIISQQMEAGNLCLSLDNQQPLNPYKYGDLSEITFLDDNMMQKSSGQLTPYESQFGLQGKIFRHLARYIDYENRINNLNFLCAVAVAIVFTTMVFMIRKKYNTLMAGCFYVTFLLAPGIINFARNLYWVEFTWFLPMLVGLFCSMHITERKYRVISYAAAFFSIVIKSLCGYEYISTIMMGLIAFLLADFVLALINQDKKQAISLFRTIVIMGVLAVIGFMAAICIHANIRGEGNIAEGIVSIIEKDVLRRTNGGNLNDFDEVYWSSFNASIWQVFCTYFRLPAEIISGISGNLFPILMGVPICIFIFNFKKSKIDWNDVALYVIFFATSVSWFVLGKAHSYIHYIINYVLWYLGYVQICIYIICKQIFYGRKKEMRGNEISDI